MLASSQLITFVPTLDPERAQNFYSDTLGLPLLADERPLALVYDAHGTMLRIVIVTKHSPSPYTVVGWSVKDIDATVEELQGKGVTFERYQWLEQDRLGIWSSPAGACVAWFKDPDGNLLSLTQF